jgi:hypothetical protein
MRERGYFAAAVSLPGYGTTSGPPDFWGPRSQAALRAALDHLLALPNIDREKVAVYGVSGAATASMVATSDPPDHSPDPGSRRLRSRHRVSER